MRLICILALCFAFSCSQSDTSTSQKESSASMLLDNLVYVDPASATTQHPLVCGTGRDFPTGLELAFNDPSSGDLVHAVFPESVVPPKILNGKFALLGRYQTIQNRTQYTFKKPPEDYQYFVVTSWEHKEKE